MSETFYDESMIGNHNESDAEGNLEKDIIEAVRNIEANAGELPNKDNQEKEDLELEDHSNQNIKERDEEVPIDDGRDFIKVSKLNGELSSVKRRFLCYYCNKIFYHKGNFIRHQNSHLGVKPHLCDSCPKRFVDSDQLKVHQRRHRGEKLFGCKICLKSFYTANYLKKHQRIHTGEKPHQCLLCQKSFNEKNSLKIHQRTHTLEKPYKCPTCSRAFIDISTMKSHAGIHSKGKPFQCKNCNKFFKDSDAIDKHIKKCANENIVRIII